MFGGMRYAGTSQPEVRRLRMHMLALYPQLLGSNEPPDSQGRYKALSDNLRPIEASWLTVTMLYQKAYNSQYQFSGLERAKNAKLSAEAINVEHLERTKELNDILTGKTQNTSVRDLLAASDHLFSDIGINSSVNLSAVSNNHGRTLKGGF